MLPPGGMYLLAAEVKHFTEPSLACAQKLRQPRLPQTLQALSQVPDESL